MNLGTKRRIIAGLGVFIGIVSIFYFLVYIPQFKYKENLEQKIVLLERRIAQLERKFTELKELKEKNQRILREVSLLEKNLKSTQSSFLYELGKRGKVYSIEYLSIFPLKSVKEQYYVRTPVRIDLKGSYHRLGMLLSDIAKKEGLGSFTVDSLLIRSSGDPQYTIEANLTLSLYRYTDLSVSSREIKVVSSQVDSKEKTERRAR